MLIQERFDDRLDCSGHLCPVPILMTEEKVKELKKGAVLEVVFTDPGAEPDLRAWCKVAGHEFLSSRREKFKYYATLKKH